MIEHIWVAHEIFGDDVPKRKEAVNWILKVREGFDAAPHLHDELGERNIRPWI